MKLPKDLLPGDRLWYSKTECATVIEDFGAWRHTVYAKCHDPRLPSYMRYWIKDGEEVRGDTPPIIRVQRIASAPKQPKPKRAKVDRDADAQFVRCVVRVMQSECLSVFTKYTRSRLRAIARRLEGGGK